MKIRTLFLVVALWLSGTVSAPAQELSNNNFDDHLLLSAVTALSPDEKSLDSKAVAEYEIAVKLEDKLKQELQAIENINYDVWYLNNYAARLSESLKAAENAAKKKGESLSQLPEKANAAIEHRNAALTAVNAYRLAADEALKATAAYAGAEETSADAKARLADAAMDKKADLRRKAEGTISDAIDAGKGFVAFLAEILTYDDDVKRYVSEASGSGQEIIALCDSLAGKVKDEEPELASTVNKSLAEVQTKAEGIIKHSSEVKSSDSDAYRHLLNDLKEIRDRKKNELTAVETYFEASVHAVVKREAYYFVVALQGAGKASKSHQNELNSAAISLKTALAEAENAQKRIEENSRVASESLDTLVKSIEQLPKGFEGITSLINESSTLVSGFDVVEKKVQAAVDTKKEEYNTARRAAENTYFFAFGHERYKEWPTRAVMEKLSPPEAAAPIQVLEHVYSYVYALRGEPKNYGAYTYVLFSQNYDNTQSHIKDRYDALLQAIYRSTSSIQDFSAQIPKEKLNLFCIPFKKYIKAKKEYEKYDSDLARSYLATAGGGAILRKDIISRIRMSPGPFLLTTRSRLSDGSSKTQLLFVDLSRYPPETFDSILAAYKNTIIEHPPAGQEVWTPPVTQRVVYAGISASTAIPGLIDKLKKIVDFFVPSAQASPGGK